jgi:hypothetical protein
MATGDGYPPELARIKEDGNGIYKSLFKLPSPGLKRFPARKQAFQDKANFCDAKIG